jgi:aldose 1-epimerase
MPSLDDFGTTGTGAPVRIARLASGWLSAGVLTHGAILQDLRHEGRPLTLGSPDLAAYDDGPMRHFGAVIGPVAGRLRDGRGRLDGRMLALPRTGLPHNLHSAAAPLHAARWELADLSEDAVTLEVTAAPGEGGLPGARRFTARYALSRDSLTLRMTAETDAPTWVNMTHHGYWHLGGPAGIDGHALEIMADHVLPIDADVLPTGEVVGVAGTALDFRTARRLEGQFVDNCFALADAPRAVTPAARLASRDGATLELSTTAPGLQVFTGDGASCPGCVTHHGPGGYAARPGLALEPQHWPDAPNHPAFPTIDLRPGEVWESVTVFRFRPAP